MCSEKNTFVIYCIVLEKINQFRPTINEISENIADKMVILCLKIICPFIK